MTSKSSSRRAFLFSTLIAVPVLHRRRPTTDPSEPERASARARDRERLERLAARYGSELGELRKAGR